MPNRYIEANALIDYACNQKDRTITANDIARFPVADVQEVKHAHWSCVNEDECNYMCDGEDGRGRVLSFVLGSPEDYDIVWNIFGDSYRYRAAYNEFKKAKMEAQSGKVICEQCHLSEMEETT